ncbi:hypothetical protein PN836_013755 [Ningiella sp. W23]|uniref:hypothetical protein n=1 Tax=Ningiella sp. W23 TaxID=3023715 RepID=UPI003756CCE4
MRTVKISLLILLGLFSFSVLSQATCEPQSEAPEPIGVDGHFPGIYVASSNLPANLPPEGEPRRAVVQSCTWSDARVYGGNIIVPWAKFDRGPDRPAGIPRYDYTWVEEQINLWANAPYNKKVNLLVWSSAQQTLQQFGEDNSESMTPQWLFDLGVPTVTCDPDGEDGPREAFPTIAVHNNGVVRNQFRNALRAIYNRYKDDERINYVRFGAGVGSENYPINASIQTNGACRDEWSQVGGGPNAWRNHVEIMVRFFGELQNESASYQTLNVDDPDLRTSSAIDNAPIVVSLNDFDGTTDGLSAPQAAFEAARTRHLGIGTQGPTDRHRRAFELGNTSACTADWCNIFEQAKADPRIAILEIQTPNASGPLGLSPDDGSGPGFTNTGPLDSLAEFLIARGVTSFELYPAEFRIANDSTGNLFYDDFNEIYDATFDRIIEGAVENAQSEGGDIAPEVDPITPPFGYARLDELVLENGIFTQSYRRSDSGARGTGLRLTSFGRVFNDDGESIATVFRIRNTNNEDINAVLEAVGASEFNQNLVLAARSETYVVSELSAGAATHKLVVNGAQIDVKAASGSEYSDSRLAISAEQSKVGAGNISSASVFENGGNYIRLVGSGKGVDISQQSAGFLRETVSSNGLLLSRIHKLNSGANASGGLMFRAGGSGTGPGVKYVALSFDSVNGVQLIARDVAQATPTVVASNSDFASADEVSLRLQRNGNEYLAYARVSDEERYTFIGSISGAFPGGNINTGLFASSGDDESVASYWFTNPAFVPF